MGPVASESVRCLKHHNPELYSALSNSLTLQDGSGRTEATRLNVRTFVEEMVSETMMMVSEKDHAGQT